jgi:hypothetical protein
MSAYDAYGMGIRRDDLADRYLAEQIAHMTFPVRCTWCRGVYDVGAVEVTARYADCSMWKAPCCGRTVDDRGDTGWKSRKDYERIQKGGWR